MSSKVYILVRDGDIMAVYTTYKLANEARYSGRFYGHWDSFEVLEEPLDPK